MARGVFVVLAALVTFAAPAAAHVDRVAAPIYVVILKGKPLPTERRVPLHGSATWLNSDKSAHRVTSDKHAWPAFRLAYRATHAVNFNRVGRYPYKVDGKAKGVIVVSAGGGGGGGGGGGLATTFIHYDVHVVGHAQSINTYTGSTRADHNGVETLNLDWDTKYANVTLKKLALSGTFTVGAPGFAAGGSTANYGFKETRGDIYGPCQGTVTFTALGTHLALSGSRASGRNAFVFWSQLDTEAGTQMLTEIYAKTKQACANHVLTKSEPGWSGADILTQGLTYSPFHALLQLHAERKDTAATLWFPLDKLAVGAPFTLDSGDVDRVVSCGVGCQAQYHVRLLADVTRHR